MEAQDPDLGARVNAHGRWLPPQRLGLNRAGQPVTFYHDGQKSSIVDAGVPRAAQEYKTCSVYHEGAVFWIVSYDATARQVGEGRDTTAARGDLAESDNTDDDDLATTDGEDEENHDWSPLRFSKDTHGVYYAAQGREHRLMACSRQATQAWASRLLTDVYFEEPVDEFGGMNGDLPLLIAMVAFTMPPQHVGRYLPWCIHQPWRLSAMETHPMRDGCRLFVVDESA